MIHVYQSWLFSDVPKEYFARLLDVLPKLVLYCVALDRQKGKGGGCLLIIRNGST